MPSMREASTEADWWAVRELIVRTHGLRPPGWNWDIRHWDGQRFHGERTDLPAPVGLWFDEERLVAAAHSEGPGQLDLELDPAFRALEPEMVAWGAERFRRAEGDGTTQLRTLAWDYDVTRQRALADAGFEQQEAGWWMRSMCFEEGHAFEVHLEPPYVLATTSDQTRHADAERMAALLNASFDRTMHTRAEYIGFMSNSPSFRHDLNLVAIAPDDTFAAHVGVTYDELNRFGIFEPVCTHPDHRRHGLAAALMREGLRRLQGLGAKSACVETGDAGPANALYRSMGFTTEYRGHWWRRSWHPARDG